MKLDKEEVFDLIEYMDLKHKFITIKVDDKNDKKAFNVIFGDGFSSYKENVYTINMITKRRLDKEKIKYKVLK